MKESRQNLKYKNIATMIILLLFLLILYFLSRPSPPVIYRRKQYKQKAQFNSIQAAIEFFNIENNGYPPSTALDSVGKPYCGAMKLCEAMMGQDLLGFHKNSVFRSDGMNETGSIQLYSNKPESYDYNFRIGPLLRIEHANAYRLNEIYEDVRPFNGNGYVICDVYSRRRHSGKKTGMPILYYKANVSHTEHDINNPDNPKNRYNYKDNHALLSLGVPGKPNEKHPLFTNPKIFYEMIKNREINTVSTPNRVDSFVLISAGEDGLYGTADDMCYFLSGDTQR